MDRGKGALLHPEPYLQSGHQLGRAVAVRQMGRQDCPAAYSCLDDELPQMSNGTKEEGEARNPNEVKSEQANSRHRHNGGPQGDS